MTFTIEIWRTRTAEKLRGISSRLAYWKNTQAPCYVYGIIGGLSLWPLIETAIKTPPGENLPTSLFIALGSVVGSIGGNLIAEQLQRWVDRASEVNESQVKSWLSKEALQNVELREAIDTLIHKMDAINLARRSLNDYERLWFDEKLRHELMQLGNIGKFEISLQGSGAIALGKSVAVGEKGVFSADMAEILVTGDNNSISTIIKNYSFQTSNVTDLEFSKKRNRQLSCLDG